VLETESGSARGVDFNGARDPERIGIGTGGFGGRWRRRGNGGRRRNSLWGRRLCRWRGFRGCCLRPCVTGYPQRNRAGENQTCRKTHLMSLTLISVRPCPFRPRRAVPAPDHNSLVGAPPPRQRLSRRPLPDRWSRLISAPRFPPLCEGRVTRRSRYEGRSRSYICESSPESSCAEQPSDGSLSAAKR
jgi:hypothetical protein